MEKKKIKNSKNGYNLNSKYWQNWKANLPDIPSDLFETAFGMILGDASIYRKNREAFIKFEQGYSQKDFLFHLFDVFKIYCFMDEPGKRIDINIDKKGQIKSFWFKTFSHKSLKPKLF